MLNITFRSKTRSWKLKWWMMTGSHCINKCIYFSSSFLHQQKKLGKMANDAIVLTSCSLVWRVAVCKVFWVSYLIELHSFNQTNSNLSMSGLTLKYFPIAACCCYINCVPFKKPIQNKQLENLANIFLKKWKLQNMSLVKRKTMLKCKWYILKYE